MRDWDRNCDDRAPSATSQPLICGLLMRPPRFQAAFIRKWASERLGHSRIWNMFDLCIQVLPNMQTEAAATVDAPLQALAVPFEYPQKLNAFGSISINGLATDQERQPTW
jgi:hypothetical protein